MTHPILCFNMGSSSLKFALYRIGDGEETLLAEGEVERIGLEEGRLWVKGAQGEVIRDERGDFREHTAAIGKLFSVLEGLRFPSPAGVGHRIVHGGPDHEEPSRIDVRLLDDLRRLTPFAPLHLPGEIQVIEAVAAHFRELPQVACFDTAFHRRMPEVAQRLPLDRELWDKGVRRYGFHGLSYEYVMSALDEAGKGRVIIAHLGNGASMAAVSNGRPLDTTMGFTPTGGFMMGTRCGDLDPGVLLYLMREEGYDNSGIDRLVNHCSGLLGVSGISPDMKTLLDKRTQAAPADLAVRMFCYQIRKNVGAFAAALGGLDTFVFTGGIGEKAAPVRREVCEGLEYLGVRIDPEKNAADAETISGPDSSCSVRVVRTKEDLVIARHTYHLISR
ncbi:MAG: acetate/propionate family kinase [Nitrospirae bacterium]|nr:acetate/propionate family kinase [Nitrospirota bacterium]